MNCSCVYILYLLNTFIRWTCYILLYPCASVCLTCMGFCSVFASTFIFSSTPFCCGHFLLGFSPPLVLQLNLLSVQYAIGCFPSKQSLNFDLWTRIYVFFPEDPYFIILFIYNGAYAVHTHTLTQDRGFVQRSLDWFVNYLQMNKKRGKIHTPAHPFVPHNWNK